MQFRILLSFIFGLIFIITSCAPEQSKFIVAEFDNEVITIDDFNKAYSKNSNSTDEASKEVADSVELAEFLDLYIAYKMKLKDAELKGFLNDPEIVAEVDNYRAEIGEPYYLEKYVKEPGIRDLYEKRKVEMRLSHIMFRPENYGGLDSAKIIADSVLGLVLAGGSFDSLAAEHSGDQYTKNNGGDIYYITSGQVITEFEEAGLALEPGEVYPELVKTRFGYHIIKLTERQERKYKIRASHILINFAMDEDGKPIKTAAYDSAKAILEEIKAGADFAELAKLHSADKGNAEKGGDLDFFERRTMVQSFDQAAFKLNVGEVSDVVETKYGYHIIKLTDVMEYPEYDEIYDEIKKMYEKRKYDKDKATNFDSLQVEFNYSDNFDKIIEIINTSKDTVFYDSTYWASEMQKQISPLYAFKTNAFTVSSDSLFTAASMQDAYKRAIVNERSFTKLFNTVKENAIMTQKINQLTKIDSQFAQLMEDYTNGIYIFRLQESEVWNKLEIDSTKLPQIYEETKEDYKWNDRVSFIELFVKNEQRINSLADSLSAGYDFDSLAAKYTQNRNKKASNGLYELVEPSSSQSAQIAYNLKEGEISAPTKADGGWVIVKTIKVDPARIKTYEEALPQVISVFQGREAQRLEEVYIDKLKKQFSPKINYEQLGSTTPEATK